MIKRILPLFIVAALLFACTGQQQDENSEQTDSTQVSEFVQVTVSDFDQKAGGLVGKKVQIEGMVAHVCAHGGQKLHIEDDKHDKRIKITTGGDIREFDLALETEAATVVVEGVVEELVINEKYLTDWEAELATAATTATTNAKEHKGEGSTKSVDHHVGDEAGQIKQYRDSIKATGSDHISFYSIKCEKITKKQ